ncbi:Proteasome lid subunit RPN8/RPN11, contains Jab1/MPN metalloenzyme (JAMM) motif [Halogranum amylolyticum]|uniref:Proteasome lid subunit RPN8/RPN11, contains Jab1/MPN metalloenzyme (JAMM) motif n=1 Tax=Halogranum amylolyticum TaxID=660520 RepID=A0A1H8RI44_9EURY|nr:desampylase [Halogranum amylolyticum]SEO65814.1 Proteasome lid subunit RPN8/RPN11, contains Jab1/MPN metalloenzyme (JAMM) motif [Halogranum amylolyticum]
MTSSRLVLPATVRAELLSHAREGVGDEPREVCGVLAGRRDGGGSDTDAVDRVTEIRRVTNVADDRRVAYELDPEETIATVEALEDAGLDVVGFYHSHPETPARPSATDEAQATWTGYVYCILSPAEDAVRAWRWTGETFDPLDVVEEP